VHFVRGLCAGRDGEVSEAVARKLRILEQLGGEWARRLSNAAGGPQPDSS
jgi:hypothetical protein